MGLGKEVSVNQDNRGGSHNTVEAGSSYRGERRGVVARRRTKAIVIRIGSVIVTVFGLLVFSFFIGRVLPADPVIAVLGDDYDPAAYERVYHELGLDRPLIEQFAIYFGNVLQGDFGKSLFSGRPVIDDIKRVFPATVELGTIAVLVAVVIGVPLGIFAAVHQGRTIDHITRVVTLLGFSAPIFWLALMALVVFYARLGWVSPAGRQSLFFLDTVPQVTGFILVDSLLAGDSKAFRDAVGHLILPAAILGYSRMAYIARMTRSFMLEQLNQEYIITARIKGAPLRNLIWRHAFKNIRVQLLTITALTYAGLVNGTILVETVFSWPGLGQYLVSALNIGDIDAAMACILLIGLIFVGFNLLSDILYRIYDPRTR